MTPNCIECLVELNNGNIIYGKITGDGLAYLFPEEEVANILNSHYVKDRGGWYFNNTKDRYIAERLGGKVVVVNPQFINRFADSVLYGDRVR